MAKTTIRQTWRDRFLEYQQHRTSNGKPVDPRAEFLFDDSNIGIGWRWRLPLLHELLKPQVNYHVLAYGLNEVSPHLEGFKQSGEQHSGCSKVKGFCSRGTGRYEKHQIEQLLRFLVDYLEVDRRHLAMQTNSLDELESTWKQVFSNPKAHSTAHLHLTDLNNEGVYKLDDRRTRLKHDLFEFLDSDATYADTRKHHPVFMIYGEYSRATQFYVRNWLEEYARHDEQHRRMISVDGRMASRRALYHRIVGAVDTNAAATAKSPSELAVAALDSLEKRPAIVVIKHFEPVLVGLEGASVHAALRNTGFYDAFSRIVHGCDSNTRFIVLVDQVLTRVDASYLHDVRLFTGLQPDQEAYQENFLEIAKNSSLPAAVKTCLTSADRYPGEALQGVLIAIDRLSDEELSPAWIRAVVNSNAMEKAAEKLLTSLARTDPTSATILAITVLAEDNLRLDTLQEALPIVGWLPLGGNEKRRSPSNTHVSDAHVETITRQLDTLIEFGPVHEHDLDDKEQHRAFDVDPVFRRAVIRWLESYNNTHKIFRWIRKVRRVVAAIAMRQHLRIKDAYSARAARDPAKLRRNLLAIVLLVSSIDPYRLSKLAREKKLTPNSLAERTPDPKDWLDWDELQALGAAYNLVCVLEGRESSYSLSTSHVGFQLKLQVWLCFQHIGYAAPQAGVRYRESRGPAMLPPQAIVGFSTEQNIEMFISIAIGALGAHEIDYCEMVLTTAENFIGQLSNKEQKKHALRLVKIAKIQCDLLIQRGHLEDAEKYIRDQLNTNNFYEYFDLGSGASVNEKTIYSVLKQIEKSKANSARQFAVWSRLLGRLGVILHMIGVRRTEDAENAFKIASLLDSVVEKRYGKNGRNIGLKGKAARQYVRFLMDRSFSETISRDPERASQYIKEARSVRERTKNNPHDDQALEQVEDAIDTATIEFAENLNNARSNLLAGGLAAVKTAKIDLDKAKIPIEGHRLHGIEQTRIAAARLGLLSQFLCCLVESDLTGQSIGYGVGREIVADIEADVRLVKSILEPESTGGKRKAWQAAQHTIQMLDAELALCLARTYRFAGSHEASPYAKTKTESQAIHDELRERLRSLRYRLNRHRYFRNNRSKLIIEKLLAESAET